MHVNNIIHACDMHAANYGVISPSFYEGDSIINSSLAM